MNQYADVIKRLEKATGLDRDLNATVARLVGWTEEEFNVTNINGSTERGRLWFPPDAGDAEKEDSIAEYRRAVAVNLWPCNDDPPFFMASYDAAIGLLQRILPDHGRLIVENTPDTDGLFGPKDELISVVNLVDEHRQLDYVGHKSTPIALLISMFRVLVSLETSNEPR